MDAIRTHGKPEIFDSDQGSQFTSETYTGVLQRENIVISMDGRGGNLVTFSLKVSGEAPNMKVSASRDIAQLLD